MAAAAMLNCKKSLPDSVLCSAEFFDLDLPGWMPHNMGKIGLLDIQNAVNTKADKNAKN